MAFIIIKILVLLLLILFLIGFTFLFASRTKKIGLIILCTWYVLGSFFGFFILRQEDVAETLIFLKIEHPYKVIWCGTNFFGKVCLLESWDKTMKKYQVPSSNENIFEVGKTITELSGRVLRIETTMK